MYCPDFSDICNDEIWNYKDFGDFLKKSSENAKETAQTETDKRRRLDVSLEFEDFPKKLPIESYCEHKTVNPTNKSKGHDINSDIDMTINKTTKSKKLSNSLRKENKFYEFSKLPDIGAFKSNCSGKNIKKDDDDDEFWDFLTHTSGKYDLESLSDAQWEEFRSCPSAVSSSGYGSLESRTGEEIHVSGFSNTLTTPMAYNAASNTITANDFENRSFNISYYNEKNINIEESDRSTERISRNILNEFDDSLKSQYHISTNDEICFDTVTKKSHDELWDPLNAEHSINLTYNGENLDNEDKFWDFLKSGTSAAGDVKNDFESLSAAELEEELRNLSSIKVSPTDAVSSKYKDFHTSEVSNAVSPVTCDNNQSQLISSEGEIFKELDFLDEINTADEELQQKTEQHQQSHGNSNQILNNNSQNGKNKLYKKSNSVAPAIKLTDKNKSYDPKIINQNIPIAVLPPLSASIPLRISQSKIPNKNQLQNFQNSEQTSDNAKYIINQGNNGCFKQVTDSPYIFINPYTGIEKNHLKSNVVKMTESSSNTASYLPIKMKPVVNKIDSQTNINNLQDSVNIQSKFKIENSTAQLPIISSVFSIPSSLYDRSDFSLPQQISSNSKEFSVNTSYSNCFIATPIENLDISQKKVISEDSSTSNIVNYTEKRGSTCISLQKQKNEKRVLPQSSSKTSLFQTADSSLNVQNDSENFSLKNTFNNKRLKTNESINSNNAINSGIPASGTQKYFSQIAPKSFSVTCTSSSTTSSSTPVYWIVSQNPQPTQNKHPGILMILNNDNQIINNSNLKMQANLKNSTVPISTTTTIPAVINIQMPKSNKQTSSTFFQQTQFNAVNVSNSESAAGLTETSNNIKLNTLNNLKVQPISCTLKTQVLENCETNQAKSTSTSLPQNCIVTNNPNIYTIPTDASNIVSLSLSQNNMSTNSSKSLYIQNGNLRVNQTPLTGISTYYSLNTAQSKPGNSYSAPGGLLPMQRVNQSPKQKFRPIKSIPLGKDKNAIQQIRIPVKIADIKNSLSTNIYEDSVLSGNILDFQNVKVSKTVPNIFNQIKPIQNIVTSEMQTQNKIYDFIPYKPKTDSMLAKKNIVSCETEVMNKNQFLNLQTSSSGGKPVEVKEISNSSFSHEDSKTIESKPMNVLPAKSHNVDPNSTENSLSVNKIAVKNCEIAPVAFTDGSQKSTLATLQELFPPPVSMIPVCVKQTVQTTNKPAVTKVVVLQNTNLSSSGAEISNKSQRKFVSNKTLKTKKIGRKTVRELLQERYRDLPSTEVHQPQISAKILRPIYKLGDNGLLLPPDLPNFTNKFPTVSNSEYITGIKRNLPSHPNKRPNIMILPSAAKITQNTIPSINDSKSDSQPEFHTADRLYPYNNEISKTPSDFLFEKMTTSKEYRPRYYDMNELRIGYFKVEDDVDSYGRFYSKFKVLFKKSSFAYVFPVTKCNQIDKTKNYSDEEIVHIQVSFKTVLSMNMENRYILIQVNKTPQVFFKSTEGESNFTSDVKEKNIIIQSIRDSLQNSFIHKITLRKRQADNLKVKLCQFDSRFLVLCNAGSNITMVEALSFYEEIANQNLRKIVQKTRRSVIRRLPQWDSDHIYEPLELLNSDHLVSPNHVCSCRISCRSLRCSCVKAAKSCGINNAACLCMNCDNPLNILQSFGISIEFSLNDSCLFQNIYQIPKLRKFLERNVNLNCCNTVARILDCIPGTILCPNTECNAQLEFSWCGIVICYPEKNPRNHCSYCGQCCFSNSRHCPVCNICYVVTPINSDCPHCRGFMMNPVSQNIESEDDEFHTANSFEHSTKKFAKPEIIVLDGPFNTNNGVEEPLSLSKDYGGSVEKESKEYMHLNGKYSDIKDDNIIHSLFSGTIANTSANSELKDHLINESDDSGVKNKKGMFEIHKEIKTEEKSGKR